MATRSGRRCDVCATAIRSVLTAAVWIDTEGVGDTLLAHDRCVPERLERPGRFYYIALDRICHARGEHSSLESWKRHLHEKSWYRLADDRVLERAHIIADSIGPHRYPKRLRVSPPASMRARVLERDGFICRRCGATGNDAKLVMDHVVPIARGGKTSIDNLQTLCWDCNSGKRAQEPTPHDLRGLHLVEGP